MVKTKHFFFSYFNYSFRFCPSAFAYLIAIVPCIWLLELNQSYHASLISNHTGKFSTIPRRFEIKTPTIPYLVEDNSDSKENNITDMNRRKRAISATTEKQELMFDEIFETPKKIMLKVKFIR